MSRGPTEQAQTEFQGAIQPKNLGSQGATITPDANAAESQVFTLGASATIAAPINPGPIGQKLHLVFIQGGAGSFTITWNAAYRNAAAPTAGAAGTRASAEFRYDGVSWQTVGQSTVFA